MVAVLPARKVQAWLLSYWHNKINGIRTWLLSCRPGKSRHDCCPTGTIKKKKIKIKKKKNFVLSRAQIHSWPYPGHPFSQQLRNQGTKERRILFISSIYRGDSQHSHYKDGQRPQTSLTDIKNTRAIRRIF